MAAAAALADVAAAIAQADARLRRGATDEAITLARTLTQTAPDRVEPWLILARAAQMQNDLPAMLNGARAALALQPDHVGAILARIEAEIMNGETAAARARLDALRAARPENPAILRRAAETYTHLGAHAEADACIQAAMKLAPGDADTLYQAAASDLAMGRLEDAEAKFDAVLAQHPDDFDAAYNRATLRKQTSARHHVDSLEAALARIGAAKAPYALRYALAKELEDLGEAERSFDHLAHGAAQRRRQMSYRVETDIEAMQAIKSAFDSAFFAKAASGYTDEAPIFIVGLPRSGTTLVDRILSRHPQIESRGELNDLALAVTRAAGKSADKRERIARAASVDLAALGESYCGSVRGAGARAPVFVDKTPLNFLYLGLIARALPNAKIIHLQRHPMASGYAMLKTLFRMGYPFSYDQDDIARYQLAYLDLMQHWRTHLGARILDIRYEDLVAHQERETRRLLAHCDLDWRDECLHFSEASGPSATASAAQVRRPMYRDSLDQWRRLAHRLTPLAERLQAGGVDIA
ncbi:MAG: sulfotransferase [Pseudomonadota bacterium]